MQIRSVLWIGCGEESGCGAVADAPSLDVTWTRDIDEAFGLPLGTFDAAVVDAPDASQALATVRRLGRLSGAPPLLARIPAAQADALPSLRGAGASDVLLYTAQGPDAAELVERLGKLPTPKRRSRRGGGDRPYLAGIVGRSAALSRAFDLVERAASSHATVLLSGETGTGKELVARAIHRGSQRRDGPFLAVNCAAFPETLLESELFGHVRGAFTGADRDKKGLFEVAAGGTLFLDEIGETSTPLQAKLLRVLQEREVRPVGGSRSRRVDVRVIAATNRDLRREVKRGAFRGDVYYRLAVFPIEVPPLRDRREDVLQLAHHFLAAHADRDAKPGLRLSRDAEHLLASHGWPGNVRELENEMQRAVAMVGAGETIRPEHLSESLLGVLEPVDTETDLGETLRVQLDRIEAWLIRRALDAHDGRRAATARRLGLTREGLYKKMKRLGIE